MPDIDPIQNTESGLSVRTKLNAALAAISALSSDLAAYRTIARSIDHLRDFTGLTGGTGTDLDSIATTGLPVNTTASLVIADALQVWQLQAGTDAENAAGGIVRPDDYAASTNEKVWVRVL